MKKIVYGCLAVALIFTLAGHFILGRWHGTGRTGVVVLDFLMMSMLLIFVCVTTPRLISKFKFFFWIVPIYALASWLAWATMWGPVYSVFQKILPNTDFVDYAIYSHRFVVLYALAALVIALALPGIWWWKRESGWSFQKASLMCAHMLLAFFTTCLVFSIPPTYP